MQDYAWGWSLQETGLGEGLHALGSGGACHLPKTSLRRAEFWDSFHLPLHLLKRPLNPSFSLKPLLPLNPSHQLPPPPYSQILDSTSVVPDFSYA